MTPVRFDATELGKPATVDYYPFGPPSCNFTRDMGSNGEPFWVSPRGLPDADCG